ncbi:haloacid dehalogenase, type II [Helicocarpus griseus UAMH5409]|uniref:Haloacid dehalogenase, type II n=1 Tax=Helicocarpus griseus UAMH5409 TaxID=1447875 RepID=A0A2B7XYK4_9EURO|nr:haloacid dehalogenase, type II [Helicocarpus griseus UAMH5409]
MASKSTVLAFDLYGTLLSTESIAHQLAEHFGTDNGKSIAALWRRYQLEYTWRLNSMGQYKTFSEVTRNSLRHALAEHQVSLDQEFTQKLMDAYDSLSVFADVPPALVVLAENPNLTPVVFSNGTNSMVSNSVLRSKDLSPYADIFHDMITVDPIKKFKPMPDTYWHLADTVGKQRSQMNEIWLISGNPFDVMGAMNVGMKAAWIDRAGMGWIDSMNGDQRPTVVAGNLNEAVQAILNYVVNG